MSARRPTLRRRGELAWAVALVALAAAACSDPALEVVDRPAEADLVPAVGVATGDDLALEGEVGLPVVTATSARHRLSGGVVVLPGR